MDEQKKKLTEEEIRITEEIDAFLDKVHEDTDVTSIPLPERLEHNIRKNIHAKELEKIERAIDEELEKGEALLAAEKVESAENAESSNVLEFPKEAMSAEDKELIRLGKIYKKRRKLYRYLVAAAMLVFVLALGVTSIGGPEKVFERVNWMLAGREQTNVDSDDDDVVQLESVEEEEVYQQIEDMFGFVPVRMLVLPDDIGFLEASMGEEIQGANILYGATNNVSLVYFIYPNYRGGSLSTDVEDELIDKYEVNVKGVKVLVKNYRVEGQENDRWSIEFSYKKVQYFIRISEMEEENVKKIVENLFFS